MYELFPTGLMELAMLTVIFNLVTQVGLPLILEHWK